jgi:hypothetical protein
MSNEHVRNRLLAGRNPDEQGVWDIHGEDPNCDLGGHHHEPFLETVSGTYRNVVEYAIGLRGFFNWGSGGSIKRRNPPGNIRNVDQLKNPRVLKLESERLILQDRLKEIEKEISGLVTVHTERDPYEGNRG